VAAAAALALFMLTSADKGKDAVSPQQTTPATSQTAGEQLTPEDREIIANLDILEDPSDLDPPGDVDEMEIFAPPARSRG
jgi:hypothetical protein